MQTRQRLLTGTGMHTYEWIDNWGQLPDVESSRMGWAHPGIVVAANGDAITFHPGEPALLVFGPNGALRRTIPVELGNAHGMALVREGEDDGSSGVEYLWCADNGGVRPPASGYQNQPAPAQVVKMRLDGTIVQRLERPDLPIYAEGKYSPTSVAVDEERAGGSGDVWVADGYGQNRVHRFTKVGEYVGSIDGTEGSAGAFKTPHGVYVDRRRGEPELYVADRSNHRVQVYDLEGRFKRCFGEDVFTTPSAFAPDGSGSDYLIVAELRARLAVIDRDDRLVCYLGANEAVCDLPGWPNEKGPTGTPVRTTRLEPGKLNSPHGLASDPSGNLYVAEWLIGGRITKLAKLAA